MIALLLWACFELPPAPPATDPSPPVLDTGPEPDE